MEPIIRKYCLIGLGIVTGIKELLSEISISDVSHVSGSGLIITTFESTFTLAEIEELLDDDKKSYIMFEMTPGFYSANIDDKNFQDTLFGGPVDNKTFPQNIEDTFSFFELMNDDLDPKKYKIDIKRDKEPEYEPELDEILDNISKVGYDNISKHEKEILNKLSKND